MALPKDDEVFKLSTEAEAKTQSGMVMLRLLGGEDLRSDETTLRPRRRGSTTITGLGLLLFCVRSITDEIIIIAMWMVLDIILTKPRHQRNH